jgi:hypothetical protein
MFVCCVCCALLGRGSAFFSSKKMFRGTLSLTQENHNFIVQIGKNKSSQWTKFGACLAEILTF